jgi:glucokinase-like ROK family protein
MSAPGKADQNTIRKHNASLVLNQLRLHAPLARADLAKRVGLNRSTISSIMTRLLEEKLVMETELRADKIGRPGLLLELNPEGGCAIGVEIGVDFVRVVLTNFVATVLWRRRLLISDGESQDMYLHIAEEMIRQALRRAKEQGLRVLGIGLGVPGMVDVAAGELRYAPTLRWHNVDFGRRWEERFQLPVVVENNANAAALAEYYFGEAREAPSFIYLNASAGLGCGIVIDGRLFRGRSGFAGEVGHMMLDPDGELCSCGRRGCWETFVGPRAVVAKYRQRVEMTNGNRRNDMDGVGFAEIVEAGAMGDPAAAAVLQDVALYLGLGIGNLVNILNPQLVVLGGVLSQADDQLVPVIKETVKQNSLFPMRADLSIVPSHFGADDCVMGAVALVLDNILREPV